MFLFVEFISLEEVRVPQSVSNVVTSPEIETVNSMNCVVDLVSFKVIPSYN